MWRLLQILVFSLTCALPLVGAEGEADLFKAASTAFNDKFYERAESQFAEFLQKFPGSTNAPRALLLRGQAAHFQRKYDAAVAILDSGIAMEGDLKDQFMLWKGEALFEKEDYPAAAAVFGDLAQKFPTSPFALQAAYSQAFALFRQKNFQETISLLSAPDGTFQTLSKTQPSNTYGYAGGLLLVEAYLARGETDQAREVAIGLPAAPSPKMNWERLYLLGRTELAGAKPEAALPHLAEATAVAKGLGQPTLEAQSINLEAEVYKKLNQTDKMVAAYDRIRQVENLAIDQRRLALLKGIELLSAQGQHTNAISRLEMYLGANTNEPASDLLRVKAGELWIDQFRFLARANTDASRSSATNALQQARAHLEFVITRFTNSTHLGKAWLNLGWSHWEEGSLWKNRDRLAQSETAFSTAAEKLVRSDDQASARFKVAEAQLALGKAEAAVTNFLMVIQNYGDLPQVKNALFDKSYHQLVCAGIQLANFSLAEEYVQKMRQEFPNAPLTQEALFLFGVALGQQGRTSEARAVFESFLKTYPESPYAAEVRFAEAKTYTAEGQWKAAIEKHEQWLGSFTNSTLRAEVEFQKALLHEKAGDRTNAFQLFTNFVSRFPTHSLAPAAQNWVADFFYDQEQWILAEQNYIRIYQNTNWVQSPFHFHSRMMAARTAFFRQGYTDARNYLTNLLQDPRCPANVVPEALFVLGDVLIELPITGTTNTLHNYIEAAKVYDHITRQYPTNAITPLAWGKKGECHLQLASVYPQSYSECTNAFQKVLENNSPKIPVAALNQAEVGLGLALEKLAQGKPSPERENLLKEALNRYLNVVYGKNLQGRLPDPFYMNKAGREAGRLAETLGDLPAAIQLYRRLIEELPASRTTWERRLRPLEQKVALQK